jgi:excisionase family DNA binding protein
VIAGRRHGQDHVGMRSRATDELLVAIQNTVSTAIREWLDTNRDEIVRAMREGVRQSEAAKNELKRQEVKHGEFLTVAEVAQRWLLHPESVRRMIRQGRVPRVMVGRQNRVALSSVEAFEKNGAVPSCR